MAEQRQEGQVSIWARPVRPARGPRPAYSREQIAEAAIEIADEEGLEAASMRRIAARIGAGTMSLYRYLPSRDDLIELMVDAVLGELELPDRPSGDWRADLTLLAHRRRAIGIRHLWLQAARSPLPALGPNTLRLIEFGIGTLDRSGLTIDEMMFQAGLVDGYVESFVRAELQVLKSAREAGGADEAAATEATMRKHAPYVRELLETGKYPIFTRIVKDARQPHMDWDTRFEYGLERILDNIAASLPGGGGAARGPEKR